MSEALELAYEAPARDSVRIVIPGPPRGKGRPRTSIVAGHARIYTPLATRSEERVVRAIAAEAMGSRPPFAGPLAVAVEFFIWVPASWSHRKRAAALQGLVRPTKKPDATNLAKLTEDGCNGVVWRDDKQIIELTVSKRYSSRPRTELTVTELKVEGA